MAVRLLAGHPAVREVVIGDVAVERAERLRRRLGSEKVRVAPVDTPISMVDLSSSMSGHVLEQFARHREAQEAGIAIVAELGSDPGVSNLFARYAADRLDTVDTIAIRDADKNFSPHETIFKFTVRGVLEEWTWDAIVYEDGEYLHLAPLSLAETVPFPEPVGEVTCYLTPHEEPITLPRYLGKPVRRVDFMLNQPYELFQALRRLRLLDPTPVCIGGVSLSPLDFLAAALARVQASEASVERPVDDVACLRVQVTGTRGGERAEHVLTAMTRSRPDWNACGTHVATGVPAAIGAIWLAQGRINGTGVLSPEACVDPGPFLDELQRYGVLIQHQEKYPAA